MNKENIKTVLLLSGGGQSEHEISLISANYLEECLRSMPQYHLISVEIGKDQVWRLRHTATEVELLFNRTLLVGGKDRHPIDLCIPCLHGYPGETGHIQSMLEILRIPFIGSDSGASQTAFNKITTKLYLDALHIPNSPFVFITDLSESSLEQSLHFLDKWKKIFVKASSQGSSVGVYPVRSREELKPALEKAFQFSPYVLLEKHIEGRELEVSVYEYKGQIHASFPGEIICPQKFYSYEEKYSPHSQTRTLVVAPEVPDKTANELRQFSKAAFRGLKLRNLSRIDFFLENSGQVYLNEINTFPGLTPISMFPKMLEHDGPSFADFLQDTLSRCK